MAVPMVVMPIVPVPVMVVGEGVIVRKSGVSMLVLVLDAVVNVPVGVGQGHAVRIVGSSTGSSPIRESAPGLHARMPAYASAENCHSPFPSRIAHARNRPSAAEMS